MNIYYNYEGGFGSMNFIYCFISTLIIFYIVFAFATVGMNKAIFKQAGMNTNIVVAILSFILWPFFIKTTIEGYKGVIIHSVAEQAAALYNSSHAGDLFSGLAGAMGGMGGMNNFNPNTSPAETQDVQYQDSSNIQQNN